VNVNDDRSVCRCPLRSECYTPIRLRVTWWLYAPDMIRTCDLRFRRPTLYPAERRARGWACDGTPRRPMLAVLRPRAGPAGSLPTMPDEGYFPRGRSVLRRVHRERVVGYLYGQRALLMQATHPVAFAGLTANTSGLDAPFQRLAHTAKTM